MTAPAPKLSRFPKISLIWVVPMLALGIALWMLAHEWRNRGPEIMIEFASGSGLAPGQTTLEYKGVTVGEVKGVDLSGNLGSVIVRVQLVRSAAVIASEGSQFWIVQPEIGFAGVSGLDTLLTGSHLGVRIGGGPPATRFRGLDTAPALDRTDEGRAFLLTTDRLGGLQVHAPVFYRDIKVGEVEAARLSDDATGVVVRIRVQQPYIDLIRTNTRFWNAGGAAFQFSLFGGSAQKKSLQSILTGAIGFATPEEPAATAAEDAQFPLNKEVEESWLKWHPVIPIKAPDTVPEKTTPSKVMPGMLGG
jgi:paraquat-inducible protein B